MRGGIRSSLGAALVFLGVFQFAAPQAQAAESSDSSTPSTLKKPLDPRSRLDARPSRLSDWALGDPRWFVSARADFGYLFFRPRVSAGYGKPHQNWVGLDLVPILSSSQAGAYLGVRYRHPRFEFRSGALYSYSFGHSYLDPAEEFRAIDLELESGERANYLGVDTEIGFSFPAGPGYGFAETQAVYLVGVPQDKFVFVETLGVVVDPPLAVRQQLGYSFSIPWVPGLYLGPSAEALYSFDRVDPWVVRAGGFASLWLYRDLQVRTDILPTLKSPDHLGRAGAPWLTISARFLWATQ